MWTFTGFGFFSAIQHRDDPELLMIRARVRDDLVQLKKYLPNMSDIVETPTGDYPYRVLAWRSDYAEAMRQAILNIDYTNFKNGVTRTQGHSRHNLYMRVWSVMKNAEKDLEKMGREEASYSNQGYLPIHDNTRGGNYRFSFDAYKEGSSKKRRSKREKELDEMVTRDLRGSEFDYDKAFCDTPTQWDEIEKLIDADVEFVNDSEG